MSNHGIREIILAALAGSSSQMPVNLSNLQSLLAQRYKLAELAELRTTLDSMCQSRELLTCCGFKDGADYVCYWIPGNIPHKSPPLY